MNPLVLSAALFLQTSSAAPLPEPWVARGDEVEASYKAYVARLDRFHSFFSDKLKEDAPDLLPQLSPQAPAPVPYGYQLMPKVLPDAPPSAQRPRAEVRAYSWPWTRAMIARETDKLDAAEAALARARTAPAPDRRAQYSTLTADYTALTSGQIMIDNHIQYNRLWQGSIAANRALYDRQTFLENAVVERQAIQDSLASPEKKNDPLLISREEALSKDIHDATDAVVPPAFIRVEHPSAHRWIVRVPFATDISDDKFVEAFRTAVEDAWHVVDGKDDYRVELAIKRIPPDRLYQGSGTPPPKTGAGFDLSKHFLLFPQDAAVLTSGATTTHVTAARCIVIGTNDIKPHDLAHEFGHILGFADVYFRGYKDLGNEGFNVEEIIAGLDDIMGAGGVRKGHFTRLIQALTH